MRRFLHTWLRWEPLYECLCGYQPATHFHMWWHRAVNGPRHERT